MKLAGLGTAAAVGGFLVGIVGGHPLHDKRDLVTEVVFSTVTVANVYIYVDENGTPYATTTVSAVTSTEATTTLTKTLVTSTSIIEVIPTPTSPIPEPSDISTLVTSIASAGPAFSESPSLIASVTKVLSTSVAVEPSSTLIEVSSVPVVSPASSYTPPPEPVQTYLPSPEPEPQPGPSSEPAPEPYIPPSSSKVPDPWQQPTPTATTEANSDRLPIGVTYDPFKVGGCKTEEEMKNEFEKMKDFGAIRIYGMGCNVIDMAVQWAKKYNRKLFASAYLSKQENGETLEQVLPALKSAIDQHANGNWNVVALFAVENEKVTKHDLTVSDVVNAIHHARNQLRGYGYKGPVGAVEIVEVMVKNPQICEASDVAMVNAHSFFDDNCEARNSGKFVRDRVKEVEKACKKRVIVGEAGWPHQGDNHGKAVANKDNQHAAIDSIRREFDHDLFLFNAFDSPWKTNWAASFNAEQYWGFLEW
ncbi:glycoside hydrolase [Corynespora cassiicola Philippines]|uniref:Glycoside hydrolase n=1 Tax=Corynespora cassiicola Philippines TaxID=1448308 RepID=A0A2T2NBQ8_CORCC|nr:glycoside hydrolase [Corynespora cassiicola Philippines]